HVTLGMEPEDVIDWEDEFKAAVAQDVAIAVRGDVGKIRVLGLQVDSVVVELGLAPGVCGNDMTALNAARNLQRQALDASSILRQGRMTSNCTSLKVTAVPQGYGHSCSCLSRSELMDAFLEQCNNVNGPLRQGAIFSLMTAAASWRHDYKHLACRFCGLTPDLCTCDCPGCHEKLDSCPVDCMLHAQLADPMPQVCLTCPPQSVPRQMLGSSSDKDATLATLRAAPDAASGSQRARDIMPRENSEDTEEVYLPQLSTTMRSPCRPNPRPFQRLEMPVATSHELILRILQLHTLESAGYHQASLWLLTCHHQCSLKTRRRTASPGWCRLHRSPQTHASVVLC
ncbi:MAG: hypothetical protein ACPIOQ_30485, partial [Promethearchaeia archaeon]